MSSPLSEEVSLCGLCPSLGHDVQEEEKSWEEQLDAHQEQLEKEMQEARRMVFRLQVSPGDETLEKQTAVLLWTHAPEGMQTTDAPTAQMQHTARFQSVPDVSQWFSLNKNKYMNKKMNRFR